MRTPPERPLRVLLVCHYYPPHVGGIENVVRHEALHLARRGAEVTVLTSGSRSGTDDGSDAPGVRVVRVAAWNGAEERASVPFPVLSPRLLFAALRWARWADVVHVHDCLYMTSWAAGLAGAATRTPHVLTQHIALVEHPSALVRGVQRAVYAVAGRGLLRRAGRVLVLNSAVAAFAVGQGARPETVRHFANGVDTELFRPAGSSADRDRARERFALPKDRVLVLFVGRLVPKKGYDLLLAAAESAAGTAAGPGFDVVFVGDGHEGRAEEDRPGVHHLGALPPDALAEVYRACDVFALPSTAEGFPLTVQEAMASGLPVVTTDDPGYAPYELDREHVTLLPRDVEALRGALTALAGDLRARGRAGDYSRRYAVAGFAWEEHANALLRLYGDVLGGVPQTTPAGPGDRELTPAEAR